MNLTILRRIAIGVMLLASLALGVFVGELRWQDTLGGKTVQQAHAVWPDGTVQYGPYCAKDEDGIKLEGGGICRVTEHKVAYTRQEAVVETLGVVLMVMIVLGALGWWAVNSFFRHLAGRREARQRQHHTAPAIR